MRTSLGFFFFFLLAAASAFLLLSATNSSTRSSRFRLELLPHTADAGIRIALGAVPGAEEAELQLVLKQVDKRKHERCHGFGFFVEAEDGRELDHDLPLP